MLKLAQKLRTAVVGKKQVAATTAAPVEGVLLDDSGQELIMEGHVMYVDADGTLNMGEMDHALGCSQAAKDKLETMEVTCLSQLGDNGKVTLRIPIPYGFGAVVSVRIHDGDDSSGQLLNCEDVVVSSAMLPPPPKAGAEVVVAGDSWGTFGAKPFEAMFTKHGVNTTIYNMAAGGTTSDDWSHGAILDALVASVSLPATKYVWFTFGGNDAIEHLPFCALEKDPSTGKNKTIDQCTDELLANSTRGISKILSKVKEANPNIRVVGFGYDIMGLGKLPACPFIAPEIMPQCNDKKVHPEGFVHCFNKQFTKIQGVWDNFATTAAGLGIVDTVTLLGTLQAFGGDTKATVGHPDLDKWGPSNLWQINCIHPSEDKGFPAIFDKFFDLYWSKQNLSQLVRPVVVV